jgi:hypothetical protein
MNDYRVHEAHDEALRRQEIIEAMEASFLQDLAKAGANVPPRSAVTTALLRSLLWEKREDDLLTRGATAIETQVVKNSRRSALLQLVSQVWKVPKPEYDKVDSILLASSNDGMRSPPPMGMPSSSSPSLDNVEISAGKARASMGSTAEYDAYEALSSLSDAMAVDEPSFQITPRTPHPSIASWKTDSLGRAKDDRHALGDREPRDSVASVVFRSSPQLTSIKYTRSGESRSGQTTEPAPVVHSPVAVSQNRFFKPFRSSAIGNSAHPSGANTTGFGSPASAGMASSKFGQSYSSPRSSSSSISPSSSAFTSFGESPTLSHSTSYANQQMNPSTNSPARSTFERHQQPYGATGMNTGASYMVSSPAGDSHPASSSHSKFPLPIDLKSLIPSRDSQSGSPSSAHSIEDNPLMDGSARGSARSSSSLKQQTPLTPTSYGWPGSPTAASLTTAMSPSQQAPLGVSGSSALNASSSGSFSENSMLHSPSPIPINHSLHGMYPSVPGVHSLDPRMPMPQNHHIAHMGMIGPPATFGAPTDHVPVWVPRTTPLMPLVLCPIRSPQGEWFYTYQPISFADMSILMAGSSTSSPPLGVNPNSHSR